MAATPSTMIPLGTIAPDFTLLNPATQEYQSLADMRSNTATVIMFICNHCPFVQHVNDGLVQLAGDYIPKGVHFIAISSNDADNYPEDSPAKMAEYAQTLGYPFPYLYDETQDVARAYQATCTPDFYVFDGAMACVYRGQLDASRPGNGIPVTGSDIRHALDAVLTGTPVNTNQTPSIGCNIKWKR